MDLMASHITEKRVFENGRVFIAPTRVQDVVTIEGSVLGGENMLPRVLSEAPLLAARLFDAGTKARDKDSLRELLASRGASLSFSTAGDRTYFSGSCLPEDLSLILSITAECLGTSVFPTQELATARERILGRFKEIKTDTRTQAANELSRILFDPAHVNYAEKEAVQEKRLKETARKDLVDFRKLLGKGGLVIAIVGDVVPAVALIAVEKSFGNLTKGTLEVTPKQRNRNSPKSTEKIIIIPNKANIDMYLGAAVPITFDDPQYRALMTVTDMLGGGFAAHLMQTVRERDGLTYGIAARASGFDAGVEGSFQIWSTFSPQLFEKGVATIRAETKKFFATEMTEKNLAMKKDDLTGAYVIGLSTTHGLANQLHSIGTHGRALSYIDEYPELIRALTLTQIHEAAALIPLDKLALTAAGTFAA